ncbi:MarR family winged helix-turn-helix transcriptional regulator [Saccharibacillus alkalitolerans]|uniref:Winged helix-turn-helix transcriptional regulator n=1 Tax=Saccharibacillus alkalitolerans TaxID=2705290 RepID=A0ABX0F1G5_9BACL|nr:MarR family winged helix-turn-helix transcriptional regulator [Saccharibacillus alkalitolerans]NGZ74731.1 winged helix-turn-helix transcriptional regulator [Saccharibacillus alkalitolerans]
MTNAANLIDLMSEKHLELRRKVAEMDGEVLNRTETHILVVVEAAGRISISEIGRAVSLTRQGTHKSVQGLLEGGYLEESEDSPSRRERCMRLTERGQKACDKQLAIKGKLEKRIELKLGAEQVRLLKRLLEEEWTD